MASAGRNGAQHNRRQPSDNSRQSPKRGSDTGNARNSAPRRSEDQQTYDGPPIPDEVSASDLDRRVRQSLGSLPPKLAERVARHLVSAGVLIDSDPETALAHALAARARATRNPTVREAVGEAAYAAGKFSQALSELRAARRMNGVVDYAPMIADCERALGRPERAVRMDTEELQRSLSQAGATELAIVVAGARRDMGQIDAALQRLEREALSASSREDWVARLRYAYADTLIAAGRQSQGVEWFHRTVAADGHRATDAEERLAQLSGTD